MARRRRQEVVRYAQQRPQFHLEALRLLIDTLFARFPELSGFSVRGCDDGGLFVDHVGVSPGFPADYYEEIFREIVAALAELVAEEIEVDEILRGRTFARILH